MIIMALRTFETADAKYYLGLGRHDTSSAPIFEDVNLGSLDFMVLENGNMNLERSSRVLRQQQYAELCSRLKLENPEAAIYCVDYKTNEFLTTSETCFSNALGPYIFLSGAIAILQGDTVTGLELLAGGTALSSEILLLKDTNTKKNRPLGIGMNNIRQNLMPTPLTGFRDAVAAKKIGEYLVPKHQHQDSSKVQVGILYGGMHSGIETKIKHPWISNATIKLYHDFFRYGNTAALNEVREIVPGQEEFVKYDCGLFK